VCKGIVYRVAAPSAAGRPRALQESLDASGTGSVVWRTTASLAACVRAEVPHLMADGAGGVGDTTGGALEPWPTGC